MIRSMVWKGSASSEGIRDVGTTLPFSMLRVGKTFTRKPFPRECAWDIYPSFVE
jgi:hypothetical protein